MEGEIVINWESLHHLALFLFGVLVGYFMNQKKRYGEK